MYRLGRSTISIIMNSTKEVIETKDREGSNGVMPGLVEFKLEPQAGL